MGSVPEGRGHTSRPAHGYAYFGRRSVKAELQRAQDHPRDSRQILSTLAGYFLTTYPSGSTICVPLSRVGPRLLWIMIMHNTICTIRFFFFQPRRNYYSQSHKTSKVACVYMCFYSLHGTTGARSHRQFRR